MQNKQEQLDLPQYKVMGDVPTYWGSTYAMVAQILEQQQAISAALAEDRQYKMTCNSELTTLETLLELSKTFSVLIDPLAGE